MTITVLEPEQWRHDTIARPLATLDVSPAELEEALDLKLIYDTSDFVPLYITVVGIEGEDGQIMFERYEGPDESEFVLSGVGTGWMDVPQLKELIGFPDKTWNPLPEEDSEPTPVQIAWERWYRAKQNQLRNKKQAGDALLALKDAGLTVRGIAKITGLSPSRVQQLQAGASGRAPGSTKKSAPTKKVAAGRKVPAKVSAKTSSAHKSAVVAKSNTPAPPAAKRRG